MTRTHTTPTLKDLDDAIDAVQAEKNSAAALKADPTATPEQLVAAHGRVSAAMGKVNKALVGLDQRVQASAVKSRCISSLGEIIDSVDPIVAEAQKRRTMFQSAGIE
jgi:hypothetical protein